MSTMNATEKQIINVLYYAHKPLTTSDIAKRINPFYGYSESEVVKNIVLIWLHENVGSETIDKLNKLGAISLEQSK